jgi:hypothetical protein
MHSLFCTVHKLTLRKSSEFKSALSLTEGKRFARLKKHEHYTWWVCLMLKL